MIIKSITIFSALVLIMSIFIIPQNWTQAQQGPSTTGEMHFGIYQNLVKMVGLSMLTMGS